MARLWAGKFLSQDKGWPELLRKLWQPLGKSSGSPSSTSQSFCPRWWPLVVALTAAAGATVAARAGVGLNLSASAPRGLYRMVAGAPTRDALVVACLPADVAAFGLVRGYLGAGTCPGGAQPVLKRVAAVAGDAIDLDGVGAIVNGVRLIRQPITDRDHAGRPLPRLPFGRHVVAPAHVWLAGQSHARSWDSRYFGPVAVAGVRGVARPIFTIGEARQ